MQRRALALVGLVACVEPPARTPPTGPLDTSVELALLDSLSSGFQLERVTLTLDGQPLVVLEDAQALAATKLHEVGTFSTAAGDHDLGLRLQLRGNGHGVFAYLKGYKFDVRKTHVLHVDHLRAIRCVCEAYEQGGATTPLEERPAIRCTITPKQ